MTDVASLRQPSDHAAPQRPPVNGDLGVVAAKLARPEVPAGYVDRPRLQDVLDHATQSPVTLVTGGAGWGKTLLVASWAARAGPNRTIAWLTLDADDDEPRVFWAYVMAALRASGAVGPDNPLAALAPVGGLSTEVQRQIQVGLSQLTREVVLVIDDVSEVRSDEVQEQIGRLFRHGSPLRIVLVTRTAPSLPLHRLRVSGNLAEVGPDELAFTTAEAVELLARQGHAVTPAEVAHLLDRTDGWAAGLRLAAMFLGRPGARLADFGGSDRAVTDYLLGEVVADQSPQTWQFLLRTSLVPRVSGDLADTLTGQGHGQLTLDQLERDNAFVTALGPERRWYRYHPLLAEMLRRQLQLERPDSVNDLHERAARWFAAHDQPIDAVRHAVAARNWLLAGTLLTNVAAHRLLTTDRHALASVLAQIPSAELGRSPELQVCAVAVRFVEGRFDEIAPHLVQARSMLDDQGASADPSTMIALGLFEGLVARTSGSAADLVRAASTTLETLDRAGSAVPLAQEYRAVALSNKGVGLLWQDESSAAAGCLEAGLTAAEALGVELPQVNVLGHLGLVAAVAGRLDRAADLAGQARALAEARGWTDLPQAATAYLSLAVVAVARGNLDEAEHHLALGLETQRLNLEPPVLQYLRLTQAAIDIDRGRLEAARAQLDEVHASIGPAGPTALVYRVLSATEWEVAQASGDAAAVRSRLEGVEPAARTDEESLALAKALLASGESGEVAELLARVVAQRRDLRLAVQASVVHALAADRLRRDDDAVEALGRAVAVAEPENILGPFAGAGTERLDGLLRRQMLLRPSQARFSRSIMEQRGLASTRPASGATVEQVTDRERTVLRYLATMLSNAEIAEQMFLSPNTIKVHLRHVYRKLDVTSRRAAVRRARELNLIDEDASTSS